MTKIKKIVGTNYFVMSLFNKYLRKIGLPRKNRFENRSRLNNHKKKPIGKLLRQKYQRKRIILFGLIFLNIKYEKNSEYFVNSKDFPRT